MTRLLDRFVDLHPLAPFESDSVLRDLGDGLLLRRASEADADAVASFNRVALSDPPDFEPNDFVVDWTHDLMDGDHPTMRARDFLVVEDTRERRIVSSLCLISHRLTYDGVEFAAGQPELVATHPEFRRRGLVRAQFDVIHEWSDERGQKLMLIDGIPNFYRQFGYEMAIENNAIRAAYLPHLEGAGLFPWELPVPDPVPVRKLHTRAARESDIPFLASLHDRAAARHRLTCLRGPEHWHFEICKRRSQSFCRRELIVVERSDGKPAAAFATYPVLLNGVLAVSFYEVAEGVPWAEVNPTVLQEIRAMGDTFARRDEDHPLHAVTFLLGTGHPFFVSARAQVPDERRPYAWYVRVPDLPGFLQHVAPALEARLASSPLANYTGRIDISFYRSGVRLELKAGRLVDVTTWQPSTEERGHLAFPDLTFLQLVFGYRSLAELEDSFPDCMLSNETAAAVVGAMFPRQYSQLWLTS